MDEKTQIIYNKIREIARDEDYTYYSEIAPLIGVDIKTNWGRNRIGAILDCINRIEHSEGHPLLSAVVILKDANMPGAGFFKLAKCLGLQSPNEDNLMFWIRELRRVHDYWRGR